MSPRSSRRSQPSPWQSPPASPHGARAPTVAAIQRLDSPTVSLARFAASRLRESAAVSLRSWSARHRKGGLCAEASTASTAEGREEFDEMDVIGGNGRWRQRKAAAEKQRREAAEQLRASQDAQREAERRRRLTEKEHLWRTQQEDEERRRAEAEARRRRELEEQARRRLEREEEERRRREEQEREERQRSIPLPCQACACTGDCPDCHGKGRYLSLFLVSALRERSTELEFGQKWQGCATCGGHNPGVLGEMIRGTGRCAVCGGSGHLSRSDAATRWERASVLGRPSLKPGATLQRAASMVADESHARAAAC